MKRKDQKGQCMMELITTPIPIPLCHSGGGSKEIRSEVRPGLLVSAVLQFLCKSPAIDEKCCFY